MSGFSRSGINKVGQFVGRTLSNLPEVHFQLCGQPAKHPPTDPPAVGALPYPTMHFTSASNKSSDCGKFVLFVKCAVYRSYKCARGFARNLPDLSGQQG